jgi:hypothetical protein
MEEIVADVWLLGWASQLIQVAHHSELQLYMQIIDTRAWLLNFQLTLPSFR